MQLQTITLKERLDEALANIYCEEREMKKCLAFWLWLMSEPDGFRWKTPQHRIAFAEAQLKIAVQKRERISALRAELDPVWLAEHEPQLNTMLANELNILNGCVINHH